MTAPDRGRDPRDDRRTSRRAVVTDPEVLAERVREAEALGRLAVLLGLGLLDRGKAVER